MVLRPRQSLQKRILRMIVDCGQRHLADLCLLRNVRVEGWSRINAWATLTTYNYVSLWHPFTLGFVYAGKPGSLLVP